MPIFKSGVLSLCCCITIPGRPLSISHSGHSFWWTTLRSVLSLPLSPSLSLPPSLLASLFPPQDHLKIDLEKIPPDQFFKPKFSFLALETFLVYLTNRLPESVRLSTYSCLICELFISFDHSLSSHHI